MGFWLFYGKNYFFKGVGGVFNFFFKCLLFFLNAVC